MPFALRSPFITYDGKITTCDGAWLPELTEENAIYDDDMFVYEALKGRTWPDIEREFLYSQPDGFVLLTNEDLVASLAAWLMGSLGDINGENVVREFVVYSFAPNPDQVPDMTSWKAERLKVLTKRQRTVLRSLLVAFAERERSDFVRKHAASAVQLIDRTT